jgi:hypothetical protein
MFLKNIARTAINRLLKIKIVALKTFKLSKIYRHSMEGLKDPKKTEVSLEIVIFSKDRPLQLLALLESLQHFSVPVILPHIIYNAKDLNYQKAYDDLFQRFPHLYKSTINDRELGFKRTLENLITDLISDKITFFVDDIIVKNTINWIKILSFDSNKVIPSLRLAPHLKFCYTTNDYQLLPPLKSKDDGFWWFWKEGEYDWKYPLSVDGNVFSRIEFLNMIKKLEFKAPNTLELRLQKFNHLFLNRLGFCFSETIIVNNPINKVQSEINNLHGKIHQDELLNLWSQQKRINYLQFQGLKNVSAHQELDFTYIPEDT